MQREQLEIFNYYLYILNFNYFYMQLKQQDPFLIRSLRGHKQSITSVAFHPSCHYVASAGMDDVIILWDLYNQAAQHKFIGHKSQIHDLKFSPNGNMLASVSKDQTLRFWEVNFDTDRESALVKAHNSRIRGLSFSCDGLLLATCGDDKLVKLWSTQDKRLQTTFKGHKYWVRSCEFSPTAINLASCDDKSIIIWDLQTKKQIQQYNQHTGVIHSVKFHKLGNCLASSSHDKKIKIYDLRTQKVIQNYEGHKGPITSIDFHPYSQNLISSSDDGKTKIWDLKKGCLSYTLDSPSNQAIFSRHGDYFLTGGSQKLLNIWKTGITDSGREHININENLNKKNVEKNIELSQEKQKIPQKNKNKDHILLQKQNLHKLGNSQLIYDHKKQHFEIIKTNQQKQKKEKTVRIPQNLESKLKSLACQLDFVTKTVQILQARVVNNDQQLNRLKEILK